MSHAGGPRTEGGRATDRLPAGTVTFLFTDIEGSTRLLQQHGEGYPAVLARHQEILRAAIAAHDGQVVSTDGDAFFAVFELAPKALAAATAAQQALGAEPWPQAAQVRVRMGLHTGEGVIAGSTYVGLDVHRAARIAAAAHGGQVLLSETTRALAADDLPDGASLLDLGPHRLKDLQRPERLFQIVHPGLPGGFPALRSLDVLPHNLPVQLTSFVGRQRELDEVRGLLQAARLVTLRGPGGAGKTRLALQAAADMMERFPDGVWLVELAPIADPALVPQTVAGAVGVREPARAPLEVLAEVLGPKRVLLVLDNCEHVLDAAAGLVHHLLRHCPEVRVLATSREPLAVQGEVVYAVPPLDLPEATSAAPDLLHRSAAIRLFVDRARLSRPGFALTAQNAPAVVEIVRHLDGIPLAIELAAARVRVLAPDQIAARLADRFRLLTGGPRGALPHHQTLEAAVDWSYELLSLEERTLFRRLGVFAGGFGLEAAEQVGGDGALGPLDVLDILARLVDKSLVVAETAADGDARYRLLDTLRHYAGAKLAAEDDDAAVRRRHRDYFLRFAEEAELRLQGPEQKAWLDRLEAEHDNFRTALEWSRSHPGEDGMGLRLAASLWWFWEVRGYWTEGRRWLEDLLAASPDADPRVRLKALNAAANLAIRQDDFPRVEALTAESFALAGRLHDKRGEASCLVIMGLKACRFEQYSEAEQFGAQALTLSEEVGDRWGEASARFTLGLVARARGEYDRARTLMEETLAELRPTGHTWIVATILVNLAQVERALGALPRATAMLQEAVTVYRQLGDRSLMSYALLNLGIVAALEGDFARAAALYRECLAIRRDLDETRGVNTCLAALGCAAAGLGDYERAATLFGAFEAQRQAIGMSVPGLFRAEYDRKVRETQAALGEDAYAAAWERGRTVSREVAIGLALGESAGVGGGALQR